MLLQYYPDSDMLYIRFAEGTSSESEEVAEGVVIDFDERKRVVGIEIEDASRLIDLARLEVLGLPIVNLVLSDREPAKARSAG